jgi:hypothetical protein
MWGSQLDLVRDKRQFHGRGASDEVLIGIAMGRVS